MGNFLHTEPPSDGGRDVKAAVLAASDALDSAVAEKQCSGGCLEDVIRECWRTAAAEGLLPECLLGAALAASPNRCDIT